MKSKTPSRSGPKLPTRANMASLYHKLLYWLYERHNPGRARVIARQLEAILPPSHDAIFPEECRSLICEADGDLAGAIQHRQREIRLIKRLQAIARNTPNKTGVFRLYGYGDLSDRLDLLAVLYHDSGKLDDSIAVLEESKQVCKAHGIKFDGEDILQDYRREKRAKLSAKMAPIRKKRTAS